MNKIIYYGRLFSVLMGLILVLMAFQNCSNPSLSARSGASGSLDPSNLKLFTYNLLGGYAPPGYHLSWTYRIDFETQQLTIEVNKGDQVDPSKVPNPKVISLTPEQLEAVRSAISQLAVEPCPEGPRMIDGEEKWLTFVPSTASDASLRAYITSCEGFGNQNGDNETNQQVKVGTENVLIDVLTSL